MAIQYSGGTIVNTTFTQTTGTRGELVTEIITRLLAAGWVNVSGSSTDQVLKCVATTAGVTGLQIAVRVYDPGSGNCARVLLRNVSGSRLGQDLYLLPAAGKQWKIIVNKHQFFVMTPGSSASREFVYAGQLIVPSWLSTAINCGIAHGNGKDDSDATAISSRPSFRSVLNLWSSQNNGCRQTMIIGDTLLDMAIPGFVGPFSAGAHVLSQTAGGVVATNGYRWADNTLLMNDALVACGTSGFSDEAKFQGQLSDAAVVYAAFAADTAISLDGHTWVAITHNNTGNQATTEDGNRPPGTLLVMVA